jgi:hypothetical protein
VSDSAYADIRVRWDAEGYNLGVASTYAGAAPPGLALLYEGLDTAAIKNTLTDST